MDSKNQIQKREIKFRAWDKKRKRFGYFLLSQFGIDVPIESYLPLNIHRSDDDEIYRIEYENIEWLQYTGLLDKNGKEIYEGDILNIEDCELIIVNNHSPNGPDEKMIDSIVTVFYEGCSFCFTHPNSNTSCPIDYDEMGKIEVIGNLYENPDLL